MRFRPRTGSVRLTNLDGSGFLRGDWAVIIGETGNPAYSPTNTFLFNRSQDEFEQVMAYYWITEAQKYIQFLGFRSGGPLPPVNEEPQRLRINQYGDRQLVRDDPQGRDPPRQGRRRRRGGRRGDPPRVRPRDPLRAGLRVLVRRGGRDQRRLRRLLGRDRLAARPRRCSACRRRPTRPASRTGTRSRTTRPRRTASGGSTPGLDVPGRPRRAGSRRRADLVAGPLGGPHRDRERAGRPGDPPRASSTSTAARCRPSQRDIVEAADDLYGAAVAAQVEAAFASRGIL